MSTLEVANSRIQFIFDTASQVFVEEQLYLPSVKLFTKSDEIIVIPSNEFMENSQSKLELSMAVQFLAIMLGDVDFITYESEAYIIKVTADTDNPAEIDAKREEIRRQFKSIKETPGSIEVLIVMYDDGEHSLMRSAEIITNDNNKKALDFAMPDKGSQVSHLSTSPFDNIFGAMMKKSINLQKDIQQFIDELVSKQNISLPPADVFYFGIANALAAQFKTPAPIVGCQMAIRAYKEYRKKLPDLDGFKTSSTH